MNRVEFVRRVKHTIEDHANCYTKTTVKKGEGFVPYNIHDKKWGQVDVETKRIRIVIDLYPGKYEETELEELLGLKTKEKRKRITGFHFDKTIENDPPFHDVVTISLYDDYFEKGHYSSGKIIDFFATVTKDSSFKFAYPENMKRNK